MDFSLIISILTKILVLLGAFIVFFIVMAASLILKDAHRVHEMNKLVKFRKDTDYYGG